MGVIYITVSSQFRIDSFMSQPIRALGQAVPALDQPIRPFEDKKCCTLPKVQPIPVPVKWTAGSGRQDLQGIKTIDGKFGQAVRSADNGPPRQAIPDQPRAKLNGIGGGRTGRIDRSSRPFHLITALQI